MNCSAPGSPLSPGGFLPLQQDSPGAQPAHQCPLHAHFQWHFQTPGLPVPTEMTNTVTKEESQGPTPSEQLVQEPLLRQQREDDQNPKTDPVSSARGSPRKGTLGCEALPVLWPQWSPGLTDRSQQDPGWESNKKKLRPFNSNILAKELGILPPHPLSCVVPTHKLNITSFSATRGKS